MFTPPDELPTQEAGSIDTSVIVRLHSAEAMMMLLYNVLDDKQQHSVEQGFGDLLKEVEDLEILGMPPATLQAYRDALSAMQKALVSNPTPEELPIALGGDLRTDCEVRSHFNPAEALA
jgi:hypothetical protein